MPLPEETEVENGWRTFCTSSQRSSCRAFIDHTGAAAHEIPPTIGTRAKAANIGEHLRAVPLRSVLSRLWIALACKHTRRGVAFFDSNLVQIAADNPNDISVTAFSSFVQGGSRLPKGIASKRSGSAPTFRKGNKTRHIAARPKESPTKLTRRSLLRY